MTVRAANSHEMPNRNMIPDTLIIRRMTVLVLMASFLRASVPFVCLTKMTMITTKTTQLAIRMSSIGPKKANQKTIGLLKKQLHLRKVKPKKTKIMQE